MQCQANPTIHALRAALPTTPYASRSKQQIAHSPLDRSARPQRRTSRPVGGLLIMDHIVPTSVEDRPRPRLTRPVTTRSGGKSRCRACWAPPSSTTTSCCTAPWPRWSSGSCFSLVEPGSIDDRRVRDAGGRLRRTALGGFGIRPADGEPHRRGCGRAVCVPLYSMIDAGSVAVLTVALMLGQVCSPRCTRPPRRCSLRCSERTCDIPGCRSVTSSPA